jgi:hypothetical protein
MTKRQNSEDRSQEPEVESPGTRFEGSQGDEEGGVQNFVIFVMQAL